MQTLESWVEGRWVAGRGTPTTLVNPATEEPLAVASTEGLDFAGALAYARQQGGPALRAMTFAERGAVLRALAETVVAERRALLELSILNTGATRSDAKFDVDGASFTLSAYAELGEALGDKRYLVDGEAEELLRSKRLAGLHVKVPRRGAAIHINAFNFPAWGIAEKLAVALLAGMPVVTKPATPTALTSWHLARAFVDSGALPAGAFTFLAGDPHDLLDHAAFGDVVAFTGSGATGQLVKRHAGLVAAGVPVNVEADSVNAAVLGPDVAPGDEAFDLFVRDVFRDMTQKAGQKCTAIRRVLVPEELAEEVTEALADSARALRVGAPEADGVRMGPLVSAAQRATVLAGIARLREAVAPVTGAGRPAEVLGVAEGAGFFVDVHLFKARSAAEALAADAVHDHEVFGPVATVLPYDGSVASAATLMARGRGGLVGSVYSEDRDWLRDLVLEAAPLHGRVTLGGAKVAAASPGPGTVLPQLVHGGPGRAGGGEELGGLRGLDLYLQRTALQGYRPLLERLFDGT